MKVFAYDIREKTFELAAVQPHLKAEFLAAWHLCKSEVVREIYFRKDNPGAFLVLEADSVDHAKASLADLPLVKEGFIRLEFIPVGPFVPFESLFEPQKQGV